MLVGGLSEQQKERFSRAFLVAAASGADFAYDFPMDDRSGVDMTVQDHRYVLDFQLKATAVPKAHGDNLVFDLDVRTFNLLASTDRAGYGVLALVVINETPSNWVRMCDQSTTLAHCAYYLPLTGMEQTDNTATVRLTIPRANRLTPEAMKTLMSQARARWSA